MQFAGKTQSQELLSGLEKKKNNNSKMYFRLSLKNLIKTEYN